MDRTRERQKSKKQEDKGGGKKHLTGEPTSEYARIGAAARLPVNHPR